jgi:ABC-2 type transport system permease protein
MRELEFRFNVAIWAILNFFWLGLMVLSVELIFGQVEAIAGWSKNEVLLLIYIQALFSDFIDIFILENLKRFSRLVRHGELDLALQKPINLRFLASTRYFKFDHFPRMLILFYLIPQLLKDLSVQPSVSAWLSSSLLLFLGIFIFYNLFFILTTTNFWFINVFNISDLFYEIIDIGQYPVYVFRKTGRLFFTYVLPVAFVATFPVQILLGRVGGKIILVAAAIGLGLFFLSHKFWHFALKHYQSASS